MRHQLVNAEPIVSVVMPVYNAMPHLKQSVDSILRQSLQDFEFLIYDDGSQDGSLAHLRALTDKRIRLTAGEHSGYGLLLNLGLREARGRFIARMDADDIALPDRLEAQVKFLDSRPGVVACGTRVHLIDEMDGLLHENYPTPAGHLDSMLYLSMGRTPIVHPAAMFRREACHQCGDYRAELVPAEDFEYWWRLSEQGEICNLQIALLSYRKHQSSISVSRRELQIRHIRQALQENLVRWASCNQTDVEDYLKVIYGDKCESSGVGKVSNGYGTVVRAIAAKFLSLGADPEFLHSAIQRYYWQLARYLELNSKPHSATARLRWYATVAPEKSSRFCFLLQHFRFLLSSRIGGRVGKDLVPAGG